MMSLKELLEENKEVSFYRINTVDAESEQLFFVHKKLETVRYANTKEIKGCVYVLHDGKMGDSAFTVYSSNTEDEIREKIRSAVSKARLINNEVYDLPKDDVKTYPDESNIKSLKDIARLTSDAVFKADCYKDGSINATEIFITKNVIHVENSLGVSKTETVYDAMIEAIPTWNGERESVELYEQYHFNFFDSDKITEEIDGKMKEVKARYEAVHPENLTKADVLLKPQEIESLIREILFDISYRVVYTHSNKYTLGDSIQPALKGDALTVILKGSLKGSTASHAFDRDGTTLTEREVIKNGKIVSYHGSNQYGCYLHEKPTGQLENIVLEKGTMSESLMKKNPYLEVISMSGIQVDLFNDYIGGEIRLGYYFDGEKTIPVTGISMSGSLSKVLDSIQLSSECKTEGSYFGPKYALLKDMVIA